MGLAGGRSLAARLGWGRGAAVLDPERRAAVSASSAGLAAAAALARFSTSVARLAGRAGSGTGTLRVAAAVGGGLATASLATAAGCAAALTVPGRPDEAAVTLARRAFVAGGPVHTAGFGILVGALGLAGLRTGELPRPLAVAGLASAALSPVLSPLYFLAEPAGWLIPAGRFSGLLVSGIAGARLARPAR